MSPRMKRRGRRICFPQFPCFATRYVCVWRGAAPQRLTEATKAATKASPYSPAKNTTKAISALHSRCCSRKHNLHTRLGPLHNLKAPSSPRCKTANLATKVPNNRNPPNRRLPTRILPTEDLGLQGFPMETAQIQRSFGRLVDQHLLS